jgi:hypothetical protein
MLAPPTTGEDIFPEDTGVLEQPPTPPQSLPPRVGENILQQDPRILEEAPSQGVPPLKQGEDVLPELGYPLRFVLQYQQNYIHMINIMLERVRISICQLLRFLCSNAALTC